MTELSMELINWILFWVIDSAKSYIYNPGSASVQTRILQNAIREGDWKLISPLKVGMFWKTAARVYGSCTI